jgi:hypothetical protein
LPGPYKVILSHDARLTLGDGEMHHFSTMLAAANYFAKAAAPHKACVYDDGCEARDLNPHE